MSSGNTLNSTEPLPQRIVPHPDEDLLSLLRRSATNMGYPDYRWLLRPEGNAWIINERDLPFLSEKHAHILGQVLFLSKEEVQSHTLHRFVTLLEQSQVHMRRMARQNHSSNLMWPSPELRQAYFLPVRAIRVCPICVQEQERYDRLYWRLKPIVHCPSHRIRLLETCLFCEAPITANRRSLSSCPRCHQDYRTITPSPLQSDNPLYLGERLLLKALGLTLPEDARADRALEDSPLSTLSHNSYFYFLHVVTSELRTLFTLQELALLVTVLDVCLKEDLMQRQDLLQQENVLLFLLYHWLFLEWPHHFFTFLETWYGRSTPPFTGEKLVRVLFSSGFLFLNPIKNIIDPDIDPWLRQAYGEFHQQFPRSSTG